MAFRHLAALRTADRIHAKRVRDAKAIAALTAELVRLSTDGVSN